MFVFCRILGVRIVYLIKNLENRPIMLAQCLMLLLAYYAQNYAGIIGASLGCTKGFPGVSGNTFEFYTLLETWRE